MSNDDLKLWQEQEKRCKADLLQGYEDELHCNPKTASRMARLKVGLGIALGITRGIVANNGHATPYGGGGVTE